MAETNYKAAAPVDNFDTEALEGELVGDELVVHNPGMGAVAKPGEVHMTAKLRKVYLSITHGVGGLSEAGYQKGSLVMDKIVEIYTPSGVAIGGVFGFSLHDESAKAPSG